MAGDDRCAEYLRIVSGDDTFTTRVADTIIHNHMRYYEMTPEEKEAHHKGIQNEILHRFLGCEKQIFNDPQVKYTFRRHFNGVPGTMSNILTSGYFILYHHLLSPRLGIEINPLDDLITLFHLASSLTVRDGHFVIDSEDFLLMKLIIERLKEMLPRNELFTEDWFRAYLTFLRTVHNEALENYTYYRNDPSHQTLSQAVSWKSSRLSAAEKEELATRYFLRSFSHDLYEYYPPYMNPNYYNALMTDYLAKLPALQQLFTNPREARQVDFIPRVQAERVAAAPKPKKTGRPSTTRHKGGKTRLTFKRKGRKLSGRRKALRS